MHPIDDIHLPNRRRVLAGGLGCCLWWSMPHRGLAAEKKRFAVSIRKGLVAEDLRTLRVTEGDYVEIIFTSDRALKLHLHGIDIETAVVPGKPAIMAFDATVAGRFPVEVHGKGRHGGLMYVEVHPR